VITAKHISSADLIVNSYQNILIWSVWKKDFRQQWKWRNDFWPGKRVWKDLTLRSTLSFYCQTSRTQNGRQKCFQPCSAHAADFKSKISKPFRSDFSRGEWKKNDLIQPSLLDDKFPFKSSGTAHSANCCLSPLTKLTLGSFDCSADEIYSFYWYQLELRQIRCQPADFSVTDNLSIICGGN